MINKQAKKCVPGSSAELCSTYETFAKMSTYSMLDPMPVSIHSLILNNPALRATLHMADLYLVSFVWEMLWKIKYRDPFVYDIL